MASIVQSSFERHPVFWFDDGSLVIELDAYAFKVHRTVLTRHSPFLLSSTSDSAGHLRIDPARNVSPLDFAVLLEHLYHDVPLSPESPFHQIASIVRVASLQQLHFPRLHELALRYFIEQFPSGPAPFVHPPHLEEALVLALEYNVEPVRKGLYYSLVTTSNFETDEDESPPPPRVPSDTQPSTSENGNPDPKFGLGPTPVASAAAIPNAHKHKHTPPALPPGESQRCMRLMTRFIDHFSPILFTVPGASHMACSDVFAGTWMSLVIQPAIEDEGVYKPLETLERFKRVDWAQVGLCADCVEEKRAEWTEEQKLVWASMDEWLAA